MQDNTAAVWLTAVLLVSCAMSVVLSNKPCWQYGGVITKSSLCRKGSPLPLPKFTFLPDGGYGLHNVSQHITWHRVHTRRSVFMSGGGCAHFVGKEGDRCFARSCSWGDTGIPKCFSSFQVRMNVIRNLQPYVTWLAQNTLPDAPNSPK